MKVHSAAAHDTPRTSPTAPRPDTHRQCDVTNIPRSINGLIGQSRGVTPETTGYSFHNPTSDRTATDSPSPVHAWCGSGGHRVDLGFSRVSNFYKIRPIFRGEQLLQNKDVDCRRQLLQKIEEIEENLPFFSKFSSDFSNFYQIRVGPGTKSNFYKISLEFSPRTTFTK